MLHFSRQGAFDPVEYVVGLAAGAIVEVDGQKLAVHRDGGGRLHALSPVCTHMGCLVRWNAAERGTARVTADASASSERCNRAR